MATNNTDTICALSTVQGRSAIALIRVSGPDAIAVTDKIFKPIKGNSLSETQGYRLRFGTIFDGKRVIDEVLVSVFHSPYSYTGENMTEISCHGSFYIQQEILMLLINSGARLATPGEFSQRAFLNGKMDLAQAEAVADLIASENEASHRVALQQMKGGFSKELSQMRASMLEIVSLMELELDFAEEDVEFADRSHLKSLLEKINGHITNLIDSFRLGNVIKNGIPVAIAGATNTGKSTLLNLLLGEERAIVSDIHGTTRDYIEGQMNINGVGFRFIDTAGIRETKETIEMIGIERTYEKIRSASVVILMLDAERPEFFAQSISQLASTADCTNQRIVIVLNKTDRIMSTLSESNLNPPTVYGSAYDSIAGEDLQTRYYVKVIDDFIAEIKSLCKENNIRPSVIIPISAKTLEGIDNLRGALLECRIDTADDSYSTLVTNIRHFEALKDAKTALIRVSEGLDNEIPTDLLAQDIREALFHIGEITGEINTEEILGNIFSKFCIGK